jgi:hypothetical protein
VGCKGEGWERWEGCNDGRDGEYGRGMTSDSFGLYNGGVFGSGCYRGHGIESIMAV